MPHLGASEGGLPKGGDADENFLQPKNCSINVPCAGNGITSYIVMVHSDVT
ncbi:hypothetical protein GK675_00775 [Bifidobacteriaceae bacterium NR002]|nr:hypothetical protein [Bifidobacteriaceae bacterium NR002]